MKIEGWQRILLFIVPYFLIVGIFQFIGMIITKTPLGNTSYQTSLLQDTVISVFNCIGTFFIVFLFVKFIDKEKFIQIGFSLKHKFSEITLGLFIALLLVGGGWLVLLLIEQIEIIDVQLDPKMMAMSILLFGCIAFTEEILFRGYILKNLLLSFNKYIALIVSAILFVLMHAINPDLTWLSLITLFLSGLALGISYTLTKNLWFPITLHFSWNFIQTHLGFNVSGQNSYSVVETSYQKANIVNGGDFGFEGSILSVIACFVIIIWSFYFFSNKKHEIFFRNFTLQ